MSRSFAACLLAICFAAPLHADVEGTLSGEVVAGHKYAEGATVVAEVDPRWGYAPEHEKELDEFRKWVGGELPEVSGTAEGVTDKDGKYSFKLTAKVSDNAKLPQTNFRDGKALVALGYVVIRITGSLETYRSTTIRARVSTAGQAERSDGRGSQSLRIDLVAQRTYEAMLLKPDGKPAAGVRVSAISSNNLYQSVQSEHEADAKGRLFIDDSRLSDSLQLRTLDDGLAFAATSATWALKLVAGKNDGGTISLVAGGTLRLRALHADTAGTEAVPLELDGKEKGAKLRLRLATGADGKCEIQGVPVGEYSLRLSPQRFHEVPYLWHAGFDPVVIAAGTVTDLGDIALEPERKLEVIAVDENGTSIEEYRVNMELVPGTSAAFVEKRINNQQDPITSSALCNAEKCTISDLVRGTWRVTVQVEGYVNGTAEATIPADTSITVTLLRGGDLHLEAPEGTNWSGIWAVAATAPCHAEVSKLPAAEVGMAFGNGMDPSQVYPAPNVKHDMFDRDIEEGIVKPLPAGTYTVFANSRYFNFRVDGVIVHKGETTVIKADNSAKANVRVLVTNQGLPQASLGIVAVPVTESDRSKSVSAKTDASGVATFSGLAGGRHQFLTKQEFDWLSNQQNSAGSTAELELLGVAHRFTVSPGDKFEVAIELHNPASVWLTVKLKLPKGFAMATASIVDVFYSQSIMDGRTVTGSNGVFDFGPVRVGTYDFKDGEVFGNCRYWTRFEVTAPPAQTIDLEFSLCTLTVNIKRPKGFEGVSFSTYLTCICDEPTMVSRYVNVGTGKGMVKDKVEITEVPSGRYLLTSWAESRGNGGRDIVSTTEVVEITKDKSVTLKFDQDVYTATLKPQQGYVRWDAHSLDSCGRCVWVEFRDSKGKLVEVEGMTTIPLAESGGIQGVPPGKYDVSVFGRGYEPRTYKSFEVKKGGTNSLDIQLIATAEVRLQFKNLADGALLAADISYEALDAGGKALPVEMGGRKSVFQPPGRYAIRENKDDDRWPDVRENRDEPLAGACELHFMNVPVQAKRMRVVIKGYKTVEFDITPDLSRTFEIVTTLEKE